MSVIFAALSDSTRRLIVDRLTTGPAAVSELAAPFLISQQAVSKHLAYLESARLIERRREGRQNFCALKPEVIREVADWAGGYRRLWERNFQRLDTLLAEMKTERARADAIKNKFGATQIQKKRKPKRKRNHR